MALGRTGHGSGLILKSAHMTRWILWCVPAALAAAGSGTLESPAYYFSGEMTCRMEMSHLPKEAFQKMVQQFGPDWVEQKWSWTAFTKDVQWRINIQRKGSRPGNQVEVGSDGVTTYTTEVFKKDDPGVTATQDTSNDSVASVENGVMPNESDLQVQPVWLAFCAPRLLKFFSGGQMPSLDKVGGAECAESRSAKFEYRYEILPNSEFFGKFELLDDGYARDKLENGRYLVVRRKPPYDTGFVKNRLKTDDVRVIDGIQVPARVTYERLVPSGSTNGGLGTLDRWTLVVESACVTNLIGQFWLPSPTGNTDVRDRRYAQSSPPAFALEYRLKSKSWPRKDDPILRAQYESVAGILSNVDTTPKRSRIIFYAIAGLSCLFLVLILWKGGGLSGKKL
jgi:hypothetical protein